MKDSIIYDTEIDHSKDTVYSKEIDLIGYNKNVLEFGCSTGFVSKLLMQRGCRITGIEMDENAAKKAEEYCEKVIVGDIDAMDLSKELGEQKFETALFGDILEHLKDPKRILIKTRDFLIEDGYIVISIPNIAHWSTRLELLGGNFDYQKLGIMDDSHLKFFTRKSITTLLEGSGYFVESIDFIKKDFDRIEIDHILKSKGFNDTETKKIFTLLNESDAEAYQYVIKASPSSEKKYLERLSGEKIALEKVIKEKDRCIAEKEKLISEKDIQIQELHEFIKNKENHLHNLETANQEKDVNINNIQLEIQKKDTHIHNLEETITEIKKKLNIMSESISWKLTSPIRYFHSKLAELTVLRKS